MSEQFFDGKYEILSTLGKGGMGCVYLAKHVRLGTLWAIKQVNRQQDGSVDLLAEANLLKRLSHPALPRIVDIFEDEDHIYIVEDYIEGVPMNKQLSEYGRFPEPQVLSWAEQIIDVLHYLHTLIPNPIIFRDMKPGNIIISPDGRVKLIDFGIAREYKAEADEDTTYFGTMGYAAPEQFARGMQSDARTDIYALGVTLYHLITGKSPNDPPYEFLPVRQLVPELSDGIQYIIAKCIQRNPADRYQNVDELLHDIKHIDDFSSESRRQKTMDGVKLILCAILLVGSLLATYFGYYGMQADTVLAMNMQYQQMMSLIEQGAFDDAEGILSEVDANTNGSGSSVLVAAAVQAGDMERCVRLSASALKNYPDLANNAQFLFYYGSALYELSDYTSALAQFRQADTLSPDNALYQRYLAVTLARTGDVTGAEAVFDQLKASNADDEISMFVYADILLARNDVQGAITEFEQCLAIASNEDIRLSTYRELASLYKAQRTQNPNVVEDEIRILLAMASEFPDRDMAFVLESLGGAYYAQGIDGNRSAMQLSAESLEKLIDTGFGRASTYLNASYARQANEEYDKAENLLNAMLDKYPDNPDAYVQFGFLITEREGKKEQNKRNYAPVVEYYDKAMRAGASGAAVQRLAGVISDLKNGGWIN